MENLITLAVGILPGILWVLVFAIIFRKWRGARGFTLLEVFIWGGLITVPALILEVGLESLLGLDTTTNTILFIAGLVFIIAPVEELLKFVMLRAGAYGTKRFQRPHDGIVLGITIGLGFATIENILLVLQDFDITVTIARALTATLLHAAATGIAGFYLGLASRQPEKITSLSVQGVVIAIILHALYNFIVTLNTTTSLILMVALLVVSYTYLFIGSSELKKLENPS